MLKTAPRKGRPPIDPTGYGTRVSVRVSAEMYDAVYRLARQRGLDVAAVIRGAIADHVTSNRPVCSR